MAPGRSRLPAPGGQPQGLPLPIGKLPRVNGLWKSLVIMRKVKANDSKGVFIPQERLDLEEGKEVVVSVEEITSEDGAVESLKETSGGWIGMHDPEQLKRMIYEARITGSRQPPER